MQLYILPTYYQFQLANSKGVLLYTVWCSALSAALGSPFGRAGGEADWEGKLWPYQKITANWKTPGGFAGKWLPMNASPGICFSANTRWRFTYSGLLADLSWISTALLQRWLSKWTVFSIMSLKVWHMTQNVPHFCRLWIWRFYDFPTGILTVIFVVCANKLTLPFKTGCKTLSVTCGDSSPKGRAKALHLVT